MRQRLRQVREQLPADARVAALLAAGDPAAERAALALAINAGSSSRTLVGLSQIVLHLERHGSRGMLRGRWRRVGPAPGWVSNTRSCNRPSRAMFSAKPSTPPPI